MKGWKKYPNLKCVILCAGRGARTRSRFAFKWENVRNLKSMKFFSNLRKTPKPLFKIFDKPVLGWIIDYWKQYTNDFIFVVGYRKEKLIDYIKTLPINYTIIEQENPKGIAHAISLVKDHVSDRFIVVLGDCICKGEFKLPEDMQHGIGVWQTGDLQAIRTGYSVEHENEIVKRVIEKPQNPPSNFCGLGFYFLDKNVFDYIEKTPPSSLRNEVEITDVLQNMVNGGEKISVVNFLGEYLNITYPEDIEKAENILRD